MEKMTNVRRRYSRFRQRRELVADHRLSVCGRVDSGRRHWNDVGREKAATTAGKSLGLEHSQYSVYAGLENRKHGFHWGQISADNKAKAVGKDIETQTRNVFQFIRAVLVEKGVLTEQDVAQTVHLLLRPRMTGLRLPRRKTTIARVQQEFYPSRVPA